eukprot:21753_1
MNDFDMNLHLRAASKPELDDKYHANVINQFDRTIGSKKKTRQNSKQRPRLYDKYHAFTYQNHDANVYYLDDKEYDEPQSEVDCKYTYYDDYTKQCNYAAFQSTEYEDAYDCDGDEEVGMDEAQMYADQRMRIIPKSDTDGECVFRLQCIQL